MAMWLFVGVAAAVVAAQLVRYRARNPRDEDGLPPLPTEHDALATVRDGDFVRLTGEVRSADSLTAAVSGRLCVAYVARALVRRRHGQRVVADILETKLAHAVVAVSDGEVTITGDCAIEWPTLPIEPKAPDRAATFLASRNLARYAASTAFEEAVIRYGDKITITGTLVHERGSERGYRDFPLSTRLVASRRRPLMISRAP